MKRTQKKRRILIYKKDGKELTEDCTDSYYSNNDIARLLHEDDINEQIGTKIRKMFSKLDIESIPDTDLGKLVGGIKVKGSRITDVQFEMISI